MVVAMIEADILQGDIRTNLERASRIMSSYFGGCQHEQERASLVMLPECFTTGFAVEPEMIEDEGACTALSWMKETARMFRTALFTSLSVADGGKYFNRGYFVLPDGSVGARYDKRHLFMGEEADMYCAGDRTVCVDYAGWRFALNICYDLRFPVWGRNRRGDDGRFYDVMLNVSNWPVSRMDVADVLTRARAIENQSYMFFCNRVGKDHLTTYCGGSAAVDPKGRNIGDVREVDGVRIVTAVLDDLWHRSFREYFPVLEDADCFSIRND